MIVFVYYNFPPEDAISVVLPASYVSAQFCLLAMWTQKIPITLSVAPATKNHSCILLLHSGGFNFRGVAWFLCCAPFSFASCLVDLSVCVSSLKLSLRPSEAFSTKILHRACTPLCGHVLHSALRRLGSNFADFCSPLLSQFFVLLRRGRRDDSGETRCEGKSNSVYLMFGDFLSVISFQTAAKKLRAQWYSFLPLFIFEPCTWSLRLDVVPA